MITIIRNEKISQVIGEVSDKIAKGFDCKELWEIFPTNNYNVAILDALKDSPEEVGIANVRITEEIFFFVREGKLIFITQNCLSVEGYPVFRKSKT